MAFDHSAARSQMASIIGWMGGTSGAFTFGAATFSGVVARPEPDAHLVDLEVGEGRLVAVHVGAGALVTWPKAGEFVNHTASGQDWQVAWVDAAPGNPTTILYCRRP